MQYFRRRAIAYWGYCNPASSFLGFFSNSSQFVFTCKFAERIQWNI